MTRAPRFPLLGFGMAAVAVAFALGLGYLGYRASHRLSAGPQAVHTPAPSAGDGVDFEILALAPDTTAILKTKDSLVVTVGLANGGGRDLAGCLSVTLLDKNGVALGADERPLVQDAVAAGYRFEFPLPKESTDDLKLRCRFDGDEFTAPVNTLLVAKAHETTVAASQEYHSGSLAAVRCGVHGVKSLTETIPLAGAEVEIRLQAKDRVFELFKGKAGADGVADAHFKMPQLPPGQYTMVVATKSELGAEKLERQIKVKTDSKVLLVTDKPLYQPGQVIHIRALSLKPFDLTPVAGEELLFEVEDAKGNKVFKRTLQTSDHGIASVDFQLADEVNTGHYQVRATLGATQAQKTVDVKKYVLPKFKTDVKTDKTFYLPKETIQLDLQSDYFFGKPIAGGKVEVTASTFDVQFQKFSTHNGATDAQGHSKFEIVLPEYFVGQPIQHGNALVKLDIKVTDTADHSETITKTYAVSEQPIRVSLIPEGGRLLPGMENKVFAAALYPDGSPARCDLRLWLGTAAKGKPLAEVRTNEAGLAEFSFTPLAEHFRQDQWVQQPIEMMGGQQTQIWGPRFLCDLFAEARDAKGNSAKAAAAVNSDARGDNVLLRLNKAIYQGGESMNIEVRTSSGMPTTYIDVVRSGQTMLTKWLDIKDGKAAHRLDLPANVFGTLEVHAYQTLASGEILRDSRVIYVHPRDELKIAVQPDQAVYTPGQEGKIRFTVTDHAGRPTPAALGVLIVDEAVYALQEMQPGLEKVFFTLQEELTKPSAQVFKPGESIDNLVRQPEVPLAKQQIAQALLATVKPKPPARWEVAPNFERQKKAAMQMQQIGTFLYRYAIEGHDYMTHDKDARRWRFKPDLLKEMVQKRWLDGGLLLDPFGSNLSLDSLAKVEKHFTVDRLAEAQTHFRAQQLAWALINYSTTHADKLYKNDRWRFSESVLEDARRHQGLQDHVLKDAWGKSFKLLEQDVKRQHQMGGTQFDYYELVSAGPDGVFGTVDDVLALSMNQWHDFQYWWVADGSRLAQLLPDVRNRMHARYRFGRGEGKGGMREMLLEDRLQRANKEMAPGMPAAFGGFDAKFEQAKTTGAAPQQDGQGGGGKPGAGAPALRVREHFPETMLWQPALITDDKGVCVLPVQFADSITTWRLSASASSTAGLLGGVNAPLRVFQDFFVDLDLPVSLTQNDEVAFPVAVYNYLKTPQTVKIDLQKDEWFDLLDSEGLSRTLSLQPNEVTSIKFRIKAKKIGYQPLTVKAHGSKLSDAIKRVVEVVPDGAKVEQVFADRLSGTVKQTVTIPEHAVADASKILVKVYPGVVSQVMEGMDGMLRMPHGCMEQTSSAAYPNVLVVDYIKKAKIANPQALLKAETFLNVGYQRLLTFERPGGGFDWWGNGPPLVWLSAYALQEFNDMGKVYPIDRGVIDRTQKWLMAQRAADGTWSNIGATHAETIAQMGNAKLLLTSYVVWSLLDSGLRTPELDKSVEYIQTHVDDAKDNTYVLALVANALAAWDAKDDRTFAVLQKLDKMKVEKPEWKAASFPTGGRSITYARGDAVTVETTALTTLAMLKSGQFTTTVNQALNYLIKTKQASGHWGSTSATILSLKALIAGLGGAKQEAKAPFTILVNGKEAAKGEVTAENSDVLQLFDLKDHTKVGANDIEIKVAGETSLMYQIVGRHFEAHKNAKPQAEVLSVSVDYDRTELSTSDLLRAKATLKYQGDAPTYQVIVDLGIPPGFTIDAGDFAEMVGSKKPESKIEKFGVTARTVTLYIGDVKPGDIKTFEYTLKPKYPLKAKTPATTAYEYYTPSNNATAAPVEIKVVEKK